MDLEGTPKTIFYTKKTGRICCLRMFVGHNTIIFHMFELIFNPFISILFQMTLTLFYFYSKFYSNLIFWKRNNDEICSTFVLHHKNKQTYEKSRETGFLKMFSIYSECRYPVRYFFYQWTSLNGYLWQMFS